MSDSEQEQVAQPTVKTPEQSRAKKEETITVSKAGLWRGVSAVLVVLLVVSVFTGGFSFDGTPTGGAVAGNAAAPTAQGGAQGGTAPSVDMAALVDDDAFKGDPDAPVTIIEFSDFECPFCGRFFSETEGQIEEKYIKTGKVKFVYRDFPLSFHQNAQKAAEAAECAEEQGKFWEMHDLLFSQGVQGGVTAFKQYASQLGLDTATFNRCLDSNEMASEVLSDFADGQRAGIQGTPGFIINGKLVSGAQPFQVFQQVIEAELAS